jgi:protein tyrosine/serine phosphatase
MRPRPSTIIWSILAALALGAGVYAAVRPEFVPRRFGVVEEGKIYRSGRLSPAAVARLHEEKGIRTIIDFGAWEPESVEERREQRTAEALGITRHVFRLEGDSRGDPNAYVKALRIMNDPKAQPVLVHCSAGSERTGCVVMLQRHFHENYTPEQAYAEAQNYDHRPHKNPYLIETFMDWKGPIRESLRTGEPIPFTMPTIATPCSID